MILSDSLTVTLTFVLVIVSYKLNISASTDSLECGSQIECICPGNTVNFECTIVGAIATVWKGSFFDCPSNGIVLRHRSFAPGINGTCNSGKVMATGIEVVNNRYSSQLVVTVDSGMNNGSVECIRDGSTETTVGICPLVLTTEFHLPTDGIGVSAISSQQFTLHWSPPRRCPFVTNYIITAVDCGVCPNITTDTFITCRNLTVNGQLCSMEIQARACENDIKHSNYINFNMLLKAPDIPEVSTAKYQAMNTISHNRILRVTVKEVAQFNITAGIDGSATSYTITYIDSISGSVCGVSTLVASSCRSRVCNDWFEVSPSLCKNSSNITVAAFATNILGDGPPLYFSLYMPKFDGVENSPTYEKCELNLIMTILFGLTASVLFIVITIASVNFTVWRIMRRHSLKNKEHKSVENIIYEDIEQHQPSSSLCDTTQNVAYSNATSCK